MIIERLRQETKNKHASLDHLVFPLIQSIRTVEDYAIVLKIFYGYFKPVYDLIDQHLNKKALPDYGARRKPEVILADLDTITGDHNIPYICTAVPSITNSAQAFGALYVLEGSTMGGAIITKKITDNLQMEVVRGLTFFNGYGDHNPLLWRLFLEALENPDNIKHEDELVQTASDTFTLFHEWIVQQHTHNNSMTAQPQL